MLYYLYMEFSFILSAFIGGVLTFLAPCTLPLIPGYLAYISGVSLRAIQAGHIDKALRRKVFLNALFFVFGFSAVFIFFGVIVGYFGQFLLAYRNELSQIGGIFVIIFGALMIESRLVLRLFQTKRLYVPSVLRPGGLRNSLLFGVIFGLGWSPCIGPVLGSILLLATNSSSGMFGGFLLFMYSFGLAIPFLLLSLWIGSAKRFIALVTRHSVAVSVIGGVFLIVLGIAILTNTFGVFSNAVNGVLDFFPSDALLEYL